MLYCVTRWLRITKTLFNLSPDRLVDFQAQKELGSVPVKQPYYWKSPPQGLCCINVDGAISSKQESSAVGMVIRNTMGALCLAKTVKVGQLVSPLEVELLAIKEAFDLVYQYTRKTCGEIRTDSKVAAEPVSSDVLFLGPEPFLAEAIGELLRSSTGFYCTSVNTEANKAAHVVARFGLSVKNQAVWFHSGPAWLMSVIQNDVSYYLR